MKKAIWAVRSSVKNTGYPTECVDFESSIDMNVAKEEWMKSHPDHIIWTFDFVMYKNV